jgi:hypothetical protein
MNVDMNKVKDQMNEHWDMDADTFDAHTVNTVFNQTTRDGTDTGWKEIDFKDADGKVAFFVEVNEDSEVWNYGLVH